MRALQLVRLYALAVLALIVVGGMILRPGAPRSVTASAASAASAS
jgi:hypothetical protein